MSGQVVFGYIKDRASERSLRKINRFCTANDLTLTDIYYEDNKDEMFRKLRCGGKVIIHKIRDMGEDSFARIDFYHKIRKASGDGKNIVSILEYNFLNSLTNKANDNDFLFGIFSSFLERIDNYESSDDE